MVHPVRGEFVSRILDFDGGREVTAYLPPDPPQAIVFAGDGQVVAPWSVDLVDVPGVPPTMVVAVHRTTDETHRLHEYSPGFDPERFAAHERFVVDDVRRWVLEELGLSLPPERTAVLGVSAGAELALALGVRHPGVFGAVLAASPGAGYQPPPTLALPLPRTYLVAGTQEPFFLDNATRWRTALHGAGAQVVLRERTGEHGGAFWRRELPHMVAWAVGAGE